MRMAQRTVTLLTDDLDGTELKSGDGETVEFSIDGTSYEIDLSPKNAKALRSALATYVGAARKSGSGRTRRRGGAGRTDREQLQAVRVWARANGYEVSDRGRISSALMELYNAS